MNDCMIYKTTTEWVDASEGIDLNKCMLAQTECMLCHYWYFKNIGCKFEPHICSKCHNILMMAYEVKNFAILNVKG